MEEKPKKRSYGSVQVWPRTIKNIQTLLTRLSSPVSKPTKTSLIDMLAAFAVALSPEQLKKIANDYVPPAADASPASSPTASSLTPGARQSIAEGLAKAADNSEDDSSSPPRSGPRKNAAKAER